MDITIPAFDPLTAAGPSNQVAARFRGTDRKASKISIDNAPVVAFPDLPALITTLPADRDMTNHQPSIERDTATRVAEEHRNVRVPAWIYAIKYETDQDWHVIVGTDPTRPGPRTFFNAEISGLPPASAAAFPKLRTARTSLAEILDNNLPAGAGYRKYLDPIAVVLEGSLFFDIDHKAGAVGPTGMRPATAWEIHPVTRLQAR